MPTPAQHRAATTRATVHLYRLRTILSMGLFLVLAGYVTYSGLRLGLLLWQRFSAG